MLNLIIPACGQSTRFPNLRPKWLLTHPMGTSMLQESISGLDLTDVGRIVAVVLKQHVDEYQFVDAISQSIDDDRFEFVVLDEATDSQPETIALGIEKAKIEGAICCKDSDNFFRSNIRPINFVGAMDLREIGHINAGNKSYVLTDNKNNIINIAEKDLRVDVYRASGPGGQSVNTTDSAVRITHLPTGIVVTQQDEKSQHKNRAKALKILRARLFDLEKQRAEQKRAQTRRTQVGSGDRSERIRTYNFPQNRLTDHRINLTVHKLDRVLTGEILDTVVDALIGQDQTERLANDS